MTLLLGTPDNAATPQSGKQIKIGPGAMSNGLMFSRPEPELEKTSLQVKLTIAEYRESYKDL